MQTAVEKLKSICADVMADANAETDAHEALKELLKNAPIVMRAIGKAMTPARMIALTATLGTIALQRER